MHKQGRAKEILLARREYWPNFELGASYSQRDNLKNGTIMHDFFSATVSFNLPLYFKHKQSARVQQKKLEFESLQSEYENIKNQVEAEMASLSADLEGNRR